MLYYKVFNSKKKHIFVFSKNHENKASGTKISLRASINPVKKVSSQDFSRGLQGDVDLRAGHLQARNWRSPFVFKASMLLVALRDRHRFLEQYLKYSF